MLIQRGNRNLLSCCHTNWSLFNGEIESNDRPAQTKTPAGPFIVKSAVENAHPECNELKKDTSDELHDAQVTQNREKNVKQKEIFGLGSKSRPCSHVLFSFLRFFFFSTEVQWPTLTEVHNHAALI